MDLIHDAYKIILLDSVVKSNKIREQLSFKEHIELCEHIDTLSRKECEQLFQEIGVSDFQSKFKNAMKYGLAGIAGGVIGVGGVGIVFGATVAMMIRYIFRKTTDPCWQACVSKNADHKKLCKYTCHVEGCNSVIRDITNQMGRCGSTKKPERCRQRLEKQKLSWMKKREDMIEKLHDEQDKISKNTADEKVKQKQHDDKMAAKAQKASEARKQLQKIVIHSVTLKENTTFKEQINILNWVWNAPNYKILNITEKWDDPPPVPDQTTKKALKLGIAVAAVALPGGMVIRKSAQYLVDTYNHKCQKSCQENDQVENKDLCYRQCKYNSLKAVSKAIQDQYAKCDGTQKPNKCRQKLRSLMKEYRKKEYEAKMRLDRELRKAQQEKYK